MRERERERESAREREREREIERERASVKFHTDQPGLCICYEKRASVQFYKMRETRVCKILEDLHRHITCSRAVVLSQNGAARFLIL